MHMTQIFDREGNVIRVTLVKVEPTVVLQVRTQEKDGYTALQVGFGDRKIKNIKKPQRGHFKELGNFRYVREFRTAEESKLAKGDKIDISAFAEGDLVKVSGTSISKGFQGVVKRYNFGGAPATHGTKHAHRQPGSIGGMGRAGGRVAKGMRMAGRMGGERVTIKNLRIAKIDPENNILAIKGAFAGKRGILVEIRG